jgi:hypothetical protein
MDAKNLRAYLIPLYDPGCGGGGGAPTAGKVCVVSFNREIRHIMGSDTIVLCFMSNVNSTDYKAAFMRCGYFEG